MSDPAPKLDPVFTSRLRRLFTHRDACCPHCRYGLAGVPGPLCPECGRDVADYLRIADTTPWRLPGARRKAAALFLLSRLGALAAILGLALLTLWGAIGFITWFSRP